MSKLDIVKGASEIVVSIGVSAIVGGAIKLVKDPEAKIVKRIFFGIGGFVLSSMVGDMAAAYANDRIDTVANSVTKIVHTARGIKDVPDPGEEELTEDAIIIGELPIDKDLTVDPTVKTHIVYKKKDEDSE